MTGGASVNRELIMRMATVDDLDPLVLLLDMANHGNVKRVLTEEAKDGESWIEVCKARMAPSHSEINPSKAIVAVVDGEVAGALFYFHHQPFVIEMDIASLPSYYRPFLELRSKASEGLFLRDIGVFPEYRGYQLASRILEAAIASGSQAGLNRLIAIVNDTNIPSLSLFHKFGLKVQASLPIGEHGYFKPESNWLLLIRDKPETSPDDKN